MKTIGIISTRRKDTFADKVAIFKALGQVYEHGDEIVSGGCPFDGDRFAELIAREHQIPIKIYYARWAHLGRSAGFQRNDLIARDTDVLIACVAPGGSTEDTIRKFLELGKTELILV